MKTAEFVAADTGIPAKTVAKWLERGSVPRLGGTFLLLAAYGLDFACAAYDTPPLWLDDAWRAEERRRLREQIDALEAKLNRGAS